MERKSLVWYKPLTPLNFLTRIARFMPEKTAVICEDRRWTWRQLFAWRLFPDRQRIDAVERELYEQRWTTPVLPANARHDLRLAY